MLMGNAGLEYLQGYQCTIGNYQMQSINSNITYHSYFIKGTSRKI
jgi:hypothetical protein